MDMGISKGCVNPRFHMAITKWKRGTVSFSSVYGNGDSHMEMGISKGCVNPHFHMVIAIWERGAVSFSSLYGNGDSHMETGISNSPYGNGEPFHSAPYGNRDSHMETGNTRTEMGSSGTRFPKWKWDSQFLMVIPISSQFLYGDPHFHVVIPLWKLTMHKMDT